MNDWDRNKRVLQELAKWGENSQCADCGAAGPEWASYTLGVFICLNCSGIHRDLSGISRVKSIQLDFWDDTLVEEMRRKGNQVVKRCYEANVPPFYYKPKAADCKVLKEQWIRAKYDRKEFIAVSSPQEIFTSGKGAGDRAGYLWKRGKDKGSFHQRSFQLLEKEGTLIYYSKEDAKEPRGVIQVSKMNATFQPEKIGNPNGLQITFLEDGHTRNIFVYHKSGKDIVDWFNAIRAARFRYLKMAFPTANESDLIPKCTWNYAKEGYMEKTGPTWMPENMLPSKIGHDFGKYNHHLTVEVLKVVKEFDKEKEHFKRRWFTLDNINRKLLYFKEPLDAYTQGEVFIGNTEHEYNVAEGLPPGVKGNKWNFGLTIQTPGRRFLFTCETEQDRKEWISVLKEVISKPMSCQDYTVEATLRRKQRR